MRRLAPVFVMALAACSTVPRTAPTPTPVPVKVRPSGELIGLDERLVDGDQVWAGLERKGHPRLAHHHPALYPVLLELVVDSEDEAQGDT